MGVVMLILFALLIFAHLLHHSNYQFFESEKVRKLKRKQKD